MKTISINLYTIEELAPDIQKKVIEKNRDINTDGWLWWANTEDEQKELLLAAGFNNPEILFSGFYSQGDGASFTASVDLRKWIKQLPASRERFRPLLDFDPDCARIDRSASRYCHENTIQADIILHDAPETLLDLANELEELLTSEARDLSKEIYKQLETEYEYHISDDAVIDTLRANEYTFEADGTMRNS